MMYLIILLVEGGDVMIHTTHNVEAFIDWGART